MGLYKAADKRNKGIVLKGDLLDVLKKDLIRVYTSIDELASLDTESMRGNTPNISDFYNKHESPTKSIRDENKIASLIYTADPNH